MMRYMMNKKELQVRRTLRSDAMIGIVRYTMNVLFISHECDQPEPECEDRWLLQAGNLHVCPRNPVYQRIKLRDGFLPRHPRSGEAKTLRSSKKTSRQVKTRLCQRPESLTPLSSKSTGMV